MIALIFFPHSGQSIDCPASAGLKHILESFLLDRRCLAKIPLGRCLVYPQPRLDLLEYRRGGQHVGIMEATPCDLHGQRKPFFRKAQGH